MGTCSLLSATSLHLHSLPSSSFPYESKRLHNFLPSKKHRKRLRKCLLVFAISSNKDVWRNTPELTKLTPSTPSSSVNLDDILSSIRQTANEQELFALLSVYKDRQLSRRFVVSLLTHETDWQRSLALFDWMNEVALYTPSVFAYNVVLRNVIRAKQWQIARGLFDEMHQRAISPDRYTYSTLITHFGKAGLFDEALSWLQKMEKDRVSGDLVLYSNLIELSRKLCDYSKAISIFSKLKQSDIQPDLVAYNSMINCLGKAKLYREARLLLPEMRSAGVTPDTVSYSTLLSMYVENQKYLEALSLFSEMRGVNCELDLTTCNIMIDVYGELEMAKDEYCYGDNCFFTKT